MKSYQIGKSFMPITEIILTEISFTLTGQNPAAVMERLLSTYSVPEEKQMQLFTYLRLAASFSNYSKRLKCVQARLQALSVLIYSNQLTENVQSLLYSGLLEELVEVLEMTGDHLMEIKASALKALTDIKSAVTAKPSIPIFAISESFLMRYCVTLYLKGYKRYDRSKLKSLNLLNKS